MTTLPDKISEFIHSHHVLTLATCVDQQAHCSNMFYVLLEDEACLIFTSSLTSKHIQDVQINPQVAGSIVLETEQIAKIQGLQFNGVMRLLEGKLKTRAQINYLKRFPYAVLSGTPLWCIELTSAKFTDNRLGFGKKLIWNRAEGLENQD